MVPDFHLVSENIPQLLHWYTFEGSLNDSKMIDSVDRSIKSAAKNIPRWMGSNGTYGLAAGFNNAMLLPKALVNKDNMPETWQTLFRFKPESEGILFSVKFDFSGNINMDFSMVGQDLVLTLTSPLETVSQVMALPAVIGNDDSSTFFVAGVSFTVSKDLLAANINFLIDFLDEDLAMEPITLAAKIEHEFQIVLGSLQDNVINIITEPEPELETEDESESENENIASRFTEFTAFPAISAIWNEFALYYMPPMEVLIAEVSSVVSEDGDSQD
jgi:hypothetical protein